jgi:2-iminobutanoate/2-iminopropanoate deaminase
MPEAIRTTSAPVPRGHYSQAVRIGNFLYISGQLPVNPNGNVVNGAMSEEATQALENIKAIVEAAEGTIADIVQCTIYISDIARWAEVDGIYGAFFSQVPVPPTRTMKPVKEMHYGARIGIQAIAFLSRD